LVENLPGLNYLTAAQNFSAGMLQSLLDWFWLLGLRFRLEMGFRLRFGLIEKNVASPTSIL
jgi:hypothetical protein